jgi:hypothetical protein
MEKQPALDEIKEFFQSFLAPRLEESKKESIAAWRPWISVPK